MAGGRLADIRTLVLSHLHADHGEPGRRASSSAPGAELLRFEGPDTNIDRLREPTIAPAPNAHGSRGGHGVPEHALEVMIDTPLADDGRQPRPPADALLRAGDDGGGLAGRSRAPATRRTRWRSGTARRVIGADAAYPQLPPYLEWGYTPDPIAEYLATLDRLEALAPARYLPSHGAPDDDPRGRGFNAAREAVAEMVWRASRRRGGRGAQARGTSPAG